MYCVQLNRTISLHARVQLLGTGAQFEHQLPDRAGGYPARDPRLLRRRKVTSHGISRSEAEGGCGRDRDALQKTRACIRNGLVSHLMHAIERTPKMVKKKTNYCTTMVQGDAQIDCLKLAGYIVWRDDNCNLVDTEWQGRSNPHLCRSLKRVQRTA